MNKEPKFDDNNHHEGHFIDSHLKALEKITKQKKKEEEAREYHSKQLEQIKNVRENYDLFEAVRYTLAQIGEFIGRTIKITGQIFPPLYAVISGFGAILDIIEAVFISKEKLNRRMIVMTNSIISSSAGIASFILAFNPATAPLGAVLLAASSAVAAIKESIFWYKSSRDLRAAKNEPNDSTSHKEKIARLESERDSARKNFFYSLLSSVSTILATIVAFAVVGALTIHPVGLLAIGITAVVIAGGLTIMGIKDKFFSKHKESTKQADQNTEKSTVQLNNDEDLKDKDSDAERVTKKPIHEATETIAHGLAAHSKQAEAELLQKDISSYRASNEPAKSAPADISQAHINTQKPAQKPDPADDETSSDHPGSIHPK